MESATFNVTMHSPLMLSTSSSISPSPTALLTLSLPWMRRRLFGSRDESIRNRANAGNVDVFQGHVEWRISSDRNSCSESQVLHFFSFSDSIFNHQNYQEWLRFFSPSKNRILGYIKSINLNKRPRGLFTDLPRIDFCIQGDGLVKKIQGIRVGPPQNSHGSQKMVVGRCFSFSKRGLFSHSECSFPGEISGPFKGPWKIRDQTKDGWSKKFGHELNHLGSRGSLFIDGIVVFDEHIWQLIWS